MAIIPGGSEASETVRHTSRVQKLVKEMVGTEKIVAAIGLKPNSSLASDLVELNQDGEIIVERDCSASCRGLFAAGDVTNAYGKRIIIAAGEGAKAALATKQYMLGSRRSEQ